MRRSVTSTRRHPSNGANNDPSDLMVDTLKNHVRGVLGPIAVPAEIEFTPTLPKTRSGKIMRRMLKANELGLDPGDITTLED